MKQQSLFADADTVGSPLFSVPAVVAPPAAWQTPRQQQALPVPPAGAYLRKGAVQKLEDEGFELAAKMDWTAALLNALGNPSEWESEGTVYDAGERSQQRCACGHPIRYVFPIRHPKSGRQAQVGSTCIHHFSEVNPALFEKLTELQQQLEDRIAAEKAAVKAAAAATEIEALKASWLARYTAVAAHVESRRNNRGRLPHNLWWLWVKATEHGWPEYKRAADYRRWHKKQMALLDKAEAL